MNADFPIESCEFCNAWRRNYIVEKEGEDPKPADWGECREGPPAVMMASWVGSPGQIIQPGAPPAVIYQMQNMGAFSPNTPAGHWCRRFERRPALNA